MVCFRTKCPNLRKFCRSLEGKILVHLVAIRNIYYGNLVYYIGHFGNLGSDKLVYFPRFGILYQEKSGNPVSKN
jgi:hypothetical protein